MAPSMLEVHELSEQEEAFHPNRFGLLHPIPTSPYGGIVDSTLSHSKSPKGDKGRNTNQEEAGQLVLAVGLPDP